MRKFILIILLFILFITGCSIEKIDDKSINGIINTVLYSQNKRSNRNFEGYNLYIPQGVSILNKDDYNIKFKDSSVYYYLYVDTIAYHYKTNNIIELDDEHYFTKMLLKDNTIGYVDITENEDNYFVVVMYNYAKIESYVPKDELKSKFIVISNILSSIKYNEKIIDTYVGSNKKVIQEEKFNIFSSRKEKDSFLDYVEEYDKYVNNTNKDEDVIDIQEND